MSTPEKLSPQETYDLDRAHVFHSWSAQADLTPMVVTRAEGSRVWDGDGSEYLDFTSQLVFTNIGHQHPEVTAAIAQQAQTLCTVAPAHANDRRSQLAAMVCDLLPDSLNHVFFTNGGTEATEHAIRMARLVTGRRKVLAAYRSYHGATSQSIHLTGDQRRFANDKGASEVVHFFGPFLYRSEFHAENEQQECERALRHLERTIEMEGPDAFAALILEPVIGGSGIIPPPPGYLAGVKTICETYGILFIADEVMAGFGRTGRWFAHQHEEGLVPDLVTFAKGINSGYVPLGGVVVGDGVYDYFAERVYPGGLTYSGHPLACAAGVATLATMKNEGIVDNAERIGRDVLGPGLQALAAKHDLVGDARGVGVFWALELVEDAATKKPAVATAGAVTAAAKKAGLLVGNTANRLHITPPCNVSDDDVTKALEILDAALAAAAG